MVELGASNKRNYEPRRLALLLPAHMGDTDLCLLQRSTWFLFNYLPVPSSFASR